MDAELSQAVAAIRSQWTCDPQVGLILGTGLGGLTDAMEVEAEIPYGSIPYFPRSTAMAHKGALLCGEMTHVKILTMAGRCHLYEGYSVADLQFPISVMHALGIRTLFITNAAGGLNPRFEPGDVMVIEDHVNLMGFAMCPIGLTLDAEGRSQVSGGSDQGTFLTPDSCPLTPESLPYDSALQHAALSAARHGNFPCQRGVYVGVKGPNYETRAEYRAFRRLGGDVVGMSTIPEVLAAQTLGMRVLGLSTVTNVARPDAPQVVTSDEVVEVAGIAQPKLRKIVAGVLQGVIW
ncbi:MAG: purine-nucleoside phosphorylase [Planctomycetales bacterium]|nr:purine-nucleoside phosphorylase [Planctomycetales bacterium]